MASNKLPGSRNGLKSLCVSMQAGCEALQNPIGLMHVTDSVLGGRATALELAETDALAARLARSFAAREAHKLDEKSAILLGKISRHLRNVISTRYTAGWSETGWPGNSVAVPSTRDERFPLLRRLEVFFTKHSGYEVRNPVKPENDLTAAVCGELYEALKTARPEVERTETDAETKQGALEKADAELRGTMQRLIGELGDLIADDDPRWLRFGLNLPAAPEVPEVPENVVVNSNIPGKLLVTCDASPGAHHYRFWKQAPGVEAEPVLAGSAQEPQFLFENLTPGMAVKVFVSAVNESGGESHRSAPGEGTPAAVAA